jgi:ATP-binding cassette, subfamily B, bacterial
MGHFAGIHTQLIGLHAAKVSKAGQPYRQNLIQIKETTRIPVLSLFRMKLLWQYVRPSRSILLLALALAAVNQCFSLLDPYISGKLIDRLGVHHADYAGQGGRFVHDLMYFLLAMVGVAMVSRIAKNFQDYFTSVVIQRTGARIYTDGVRHSLALPFEVFEDQRSGETLGKLQKVRSDSEKLITVSISILFQSVIGVIFVMVYAVSVHWLIAPVFLLTVPLLALVSNALSKRIKVVSKEILNETTSLAGTTTESLRNIELVKSLGLTDQEIGRLNKTTHRILGLELRKVKFIRSLSFVQGTTVNLLRTVLVGFLYWLVFRETISLGQLMTLTFYSFFIFGPLQEMGNVIASYREAEASLRAFEEILRTPAERCPDHPQLLGPISSIRFNKVGFRHRSAGSDALRDVSFEIRKGETVAFVGPSGSGKSTLVKLLVGLYPPGSGSITYDGIDSSSLRLQDLRNQIGFVTQDTQLFAGTIRENMLFVKPDATDEELLNALERASCVKLLNRASDGLNSLIGEGGIKISGGEKQRLSIARALLRKPRLLVLDEATSALDSLTEEEITATIRTINSARETITILIAHRLSTVMHADRICVLERGQIVESGNHESLLDQKGLYYAMWRQQIGERSRIPAAVN